MVLFLRQTKYHLTIVVQIKVVLAEFLLAVGNVHSFFSKEVLKGAHLKQHGRKVKVWYAVNQKGHSSAYIRKERSKFSI